MIREWVGSSRCLAHSTCCCLKCAYCDNNEEFRSRLVPAYRPMVNALACCTKNRTSHIFHVLSADIFVCCAVLLPSWKWKTIRFHPDKNVSSIFLSGWSPKISTTENYAEVDTITEVFDGHSLFRRASLCRWWVQSKNRRQLALQLTVAIWFDCTEQKIITHFSAAAPLTAAVRSACVFGSVDSTRLSLMGMNQSIIVAFRFGPSSLAPGRIYQLSNDANYRLVLAFPFHYIDRRTTTDERERWKCLD